MALISAAMMIRANEQGLRRCLNSINPICDEIVVVTTEDPDEQTKSILKEFNCTVFHSHWQKDYSYHRNESFAYTKSEWVLRIDADEELILNCSVKEFRRILKEDVPNSVDCLRCTMHDMRGSQIVMEFPQLHFFRNGTVYWKYRKHNHPVFQGRIMHLSSCSTRHYGYDISPEYRKEKIEKGEELIRLTMEEYPDEYPGDYYLAQLYNDDNKKAEMYLRKYIKRHVGKVGFVSSSYVSLAVCLVKQKKRDEAWKILEEGLGIYPGDLDLNFTLCKLAVEDNRYKTMVKSAEKYLQAWDRYKNNPVMHDRFYFCVSSAHVRFILHKLIISRFQEGISYTNNFFSFDDTDGQNDKMLNDLTTLGIEWSFGNSYIDDTFTEKILEGVN